MAESKISAQIPTPVSVSKVGIFTNSNIAAYQIGKMLFVSGNVDAGSAQPSSGYTQGTWYKFAKVTVAIPTTVGLGAAASNGAQPVAVTIDGSGNLSFKTITDNYPDVIWFSGCCEIS